MMGRVAGFTIDPAFVSDCIERLAQFGAHPDGGVERLAYTPSWKAAVEQYSSWLRDEGLDVRQDAVGNVFGVARGREAGPSIMSGSHIDTCLRGGKLDGTLGVIAAYVAVRTLLRTYGQPARTLETLAICDEEASRFHSNFWGSRALAGFVEPEEAERIFDAEGVSLADAMRSCDLDPTRTSTARRHDIETFIELHIEQGPVLEREGVAVGIVKGITALKQLECVVRGRADHAGGCPMDARLDPVLGAAEMILSVTRIANDMGPPAVATVGRIKADPGSPNIVANDVTFAIDARYPDTDRHARFIAEIMETCQAIADNRGLGLTMSQLLYQPGTPNSPDLVRTIREAADDLAIPSKEMYSGAGHDTQVLAQSGVRTAMIFVPSHEGRSHSPQEFTSIDDIVTGISLLTEVLHRLAY